MKTLLAFTLSALPLLAASSKLALVGSQHDLTATGSGPVKSTQTDTCIFCHAPHNVQPNILPLWDHGLSSQSYVTYTSSTYNAGPGTPGAGSSKLCLSCHDGTVAVGLTVTKGLIPTSGSMVASDVLGTNLSSGHPVSFTPVDDGSLATALFTTPPSTKDPAVKLVGGKIECTTCHDPHTPRNDPATPMFLVRSNTNGAICLACHDPSRGTNNPLAGWTPSSHATASHTVPVTTGFGPYGTVAIDACANCHLAHNNSGAQRNLRGVEEAACSPCHTGANVSPPLLNVMGEFTKTYSHPTTTVSGAHDPAEAIPVNNTRHAECADCHNSHAATIQAGVPVAPILPASLAGVSGYDTNGIQKPATTEYQICYKCHADSTNKPLSSIYGRTASRYPQGTVPGVTPPPMPADQFNIRLKFESGISHNVAGKSAPTTTVASLLPYMLDVNKASILSRPMTINTIIYCEDCHNNNQARSANGPGPNGPHGSSFPHLLQFNLYQDNGTQGGGGTTGYDLCAKCHSITTLNQTPVHNKHLSNDVNAGCTACHDPHGVIGGNSRANLAMINFDTAIVTPLTGTTNYGFYYNGTTLGCYLRCHGESHNPQTYRYP